MKNLNEKILFVFLLFSVVFNTLNAQQSVIDSLLLKLKAEQADTGKISILLDLSWEYHNSDPAQTISYAERALNLAEVIDYKKGVANALNHIGIGLDVQGNLDEAMSYYQGALDVATEMENEKLIRNYLNNVGLIHQRRGNYNRAMDYYHRALAMVNEEKNKGTASILLNNIGLIHSYQKDHHKALEYFERSLKIERELENKLGISMALTNVGEQYKKLGQGTKALRYFEEALIISEAINDKMGQSLLMCNIGEIHLEDGLFELASEYFPRSLKIAKEIGDKEGIACVMNNIGKVEFNMGNHDQSISFSKQALHIAQEMGAKNAVKDIYETLANNFAGIGNYKQAYKYQTFFKAATDSLYNEQKSRQIIELSTQYETQKRETELELLKEQQARAEAKILQRTIIGWAIALILMLVTIILFILLKSNRQKHLYSQQLEEEVTKRTDELNQSNIQLKKSNKELERFAYIASHDLKEPLRNIVSFTRLIERRLKGKADEEVNEFLSYVINNSKQMHVLIEDVLEFSRIENQNIETEVVDLNRIFEQVKGVIGSTIKERNVIIEQGELPEVSANSSHIFLVIKNLIENGIKYNAQEQPMIRISCITQNGFHEISISDNGIGIDQAYFNKIFGMFKRLHNREEYQGSGLGLAICKKIINNYQGDIRVESEAGKGSTFTFSLPVIEEKTIVPEPTILEVVDA